MKVVNCCPIVEAYGQTEVTAISFSTIINDPEAGHVILF
jgi:hypothetical protein